MAIVTSVPTKTGLCASILTLKECLSELKFLLSCSDVLRFLETSQVGV